MLVALDKHALEKLTSMLRSGMVTPSAVARELEVMLARSVPAATYALLSDARSEIRSYSYCRCRDSSCRRCRVDERLSALLLRECLTTYNHGNKS
jgi:hypothetical protein